MSKPLVSVIVPVHNVEKYLCQCLDSIISQSYGNLQILIVDDGSTDGSGKICDEYAERDSRVTVVHTANHGLSAARNLALGHATGKYVTFMDSDNWLEPDAYQALLDEKLRTDADIVACRFFMEYVNRTDISPGPEEAYVVEGDDVLRAYLMNEGVSHDAWNKLYKAEVFDSIRYPEDRIFEDIATMHLILQQANRLAYLPTPLMHYRNRQNSLSDIHSMKSLIDYWLTYRERYEALSSISDDYRRLALAECVGAVSRTWRWWIGCPTQDRKAAQHRLDEMQRFVGQRHAEIENDPSCSIGMRLTCLYTRSKSPLLLEALYLATLAYRSLGRDKKYDE